MRSCYSIFDFKMASRITLQVGRHVLRGSTRMPIRLLSTLTSSTKFISAQNNHSLFSVNRQSASFLRTSAVVSSSHIVTIQDEKDFDARVLQNEKPVLVDFFATWCGPCKMLIPRLESLVSAKDGKVMLAKIDIDEHTELAMDYEVQAVPTVIAMKDGKVIDRFTGLKDEADLETFVANLIGG